MKNKEYKVLGHKVNYNVPETSAEFNKLDPKREDAACDEAVANIVYRSMNPDTRFWFLHGRDAVEAKDSAPAVAAIVGVETLLEDMFKDVVYDDKDKADDNTVARRTEIAKNAKGEVKMKDGAEVTKFVEAEEVYYNRALALAVKYKKFASEDAARAHFQPLIEQIAAEVPFDVTQAERTDRGPKKLAAKYKLAAAKSIALGNVEKLNTGVLTKIGKVFSPTNDTTKMFTGKYPAKAADGSETQVDFSVSDKDADTLGWLIKEYSDWKSQQELNVLAE